jgi:Tfp pilus tip-associated adhesin PilY1
MLELQDKAAAYKAFLWLKPVYLPWFLALLAQAVPVLAEWNYASSPLLQSVGVKPNVVLMLGNATNMRVMSYNDDFRQKYIYAAAGSANAKRYGAPWYFCSVYDNVNHVCTATSRTFKSLGAQEESILDTDSLFSKITIDVNTRNLVDTTAWGWWKSYVCKMVANNTDPDPRQRANGTWPTVTGDPSTRVVNLCLRLRNANTAVWPTQNNDTSSPAYPVGSTLDYDTWYIDDYIDFVLNQTLRDGVRDELAYPLVNGAISAASFNVDFTTNPFVPGYNRMQAARMAAIAVIDKYADETDLGVAKFNDATRNDGTLTESCASGSVAHIAALKWEINTRLRPDQDGALAATQQKVNDYFSGANSPIRYRCQKNYVITMGSSPSGDYTTALNANRDADGVPDGAFGTQSYLDDIAETGYKTDYKIGGTDAAGKSWDDPLYPKQNIVPFTIGFGEANDLTRGAPLVNRVSVLPADIAIKSAALPNGSVKVIAHGLKTGDPVMYESITKTGTTVTTKTTGLLETTAGNLPSHTTDQDNNTAGLYFAIRLDADHFALATSRDNAVAVPPVGIPITGAGSGTHTFSTGPGKSFFAYSSAELVTALRNTLTAINNENLSMSTVSASTSDLSANNRIYQTRFQTDDWSGSLTAYKLNTGTGVVDTTAPVWVSNWAEGDVTASTLTWNPAKKGSFFDWASLDATQKAALHNRTDVVDWLLGNAVAGLRNRDNGMLGDTLNASAQYMGATDEGYGVLSGAEGSRYAAFVTSKTARKPMLWFGAGAMLHGVDASDAGQGEMLVHYIPNGVFRDFTDTNNNGVMDTGVETTGAVDKLFQFAQSDYGKSSNPHRLFVDGSPTVGDAYWAGAWHTVVVGGAGFGGRFLYALEASPTSIYSGGDVLWERGADDDSVDATSTNNSLGYTFSKPVIGRMANGDWAAIVGNGYDSGGDKAQLFILRLSDGAVLKQIDTKAGSATNPNGMSSVQVKLGGADGKTVQTVYGGDLLGNIWKFDVSDSSTSNWQTAFGTVAAPLPLFTATDINGNNKPQPITGGIALKDRGGDTLVFFGTGKYFEVSDNTYPPIDGGPLLNTVYGLFDNGTTMTRPQMGRQTINSRTTDAGTTYRIGSSIATNYTNWRGWYLDLTKDGSVTGAGERVITAPIVHGDRLIFVTITPKTGADPCTDSSKSALFEINAFTGGSLGKAVFDTNGDGEVDDKDAVVMSIESDTIWSPPQILKQVGARGKMIERKVMGSSSAAAPITTLKEGSAEADRDPLSGGRTSWRQLQ